MVFYADENFPLRVVEELRRLGHDPDREGQAHRITAAIAEMVELRGKLVRVYRPGKSAI